MFQAHIVVRLFCTYVADISIVALAIKANISFKLELWYFTN